MRFGKAFGLLSLAFMMTSCLEVPASDPAKDYKEFVQKLHNTGGTGGAETAHDPLSKGKQVFLTDCATCHGKQGNGQGPAAATMNPKPRNFTNAEWQASVTDDHIRKTIEGGGGAVGLSPTMPPWGSLLSSEQIDNVIKYIRSLKK